jgi:hypothetical protein
MRYQQIDEEKPASFILAKIRAIGQIRDESIGGRRQPASEENVQLMRKDADGTGKLDAARENECHMRNSVERKNV